MHYSIHENNLQKLSEKLKRIENKCNKYGCSFQYAEVGEEFKEIQHYSETYGAYGKELVKTEKTIERFVTIEVEGTAKINNWQYLATIEHTENGNIIRSYSEIAIPDYYKTCAPHCDHCGIDRYRKDSFLILNTETNEIKQVGKSCLQDYTNGLSAELAASYASYFDTLAKLDREESLGGFTRHYIKTFDFLCICNDIVKQKGFISKAKAEENGSIPTSEMAKDIYNKEFLITDETKAEVKNILAWLENENADNQYISNLKVTCKNEYTEYRDCGILASLPSAYFKAMQSESDKARKEAEKQGQKQSEYIGNIGEKLQLDNVNISEAGHYQTEYGTTHIFKIVDTNNNIFVWRTNKNQVEIGNTDEWKAIADFTQIKGTIKDHKEYNGEKQTEITRCKVL